MGKSPHANLLELGTQSFEAQILAERLWLERDTLARETLYTSHFLNEVMLFIEAQMYDHYNPASRLLRWGMVREAIATAFAMGYRVGAATAHGGTDSLVEETVPPAPISE